MSLVTTEKKNLFLEIASWAQKHLNYFDLLRFHDSVFLLSVSGGADSVFLLHIILAWYHSDQISSPPLIYHLNHRLRQNNEAERDFRFVKNLAHDYDLVFFGRSINVRKFAQKCQMNLEDAGRRLRYHHLQKIALNKNSLAHCICTGHHANDYLESAIMHLTRGGGKRAWSTMPLIQKLPSQIVLFRPLLGIDRQQIIQQMHKWKICYCQDSSNKDLKYLRNRVRRKIVAPLMQEGLNCAHLWKNMQDHHLSLASITDMHHQSIHRRTTVISLDRCCFDDATCIASWLSLACQKLHVYPVGVRALKEIYNQYRQKGRLYFINTQVIIWANIHSRIYLIQKDSSCLKPAFITTLNRKILKENNEKSEYQIVFHDKKLNVRLPSHQQVLSFRKGFIFEYSANSKKKVKKILQEHCIPTPVRKYLPMVYDKNSKSVKKIFFEFWPYENL